MIFRNSINLVIFACVFLCSIVYRGYSAQDSLKQTLGNVIKIPCSKLCLPDSLGGENAIGEIVMMGYVNRSRQVIGQEALMINIMTDPCRPNEHYGVGAPSPAEGRKRGTIVGEPVHKRFQGWIEKVHRTLNIGPDTTDLISQDSDTMSFVYHLIVNPEREEQINAVFREHIDFVMPIAKVPKELGGEALKGSAYVQATLDSTGQMICWYITGIIASNKKTGEEFAYSITRPKPSDHVDITRFKPWIETYLKKVRFTIRGNPILQGFRSIPVPLFIELNGKQPRRKGEWSFPIRE